LIVSNGVVIQPDGSEHARIVGIQSQRRRRGADTFVITLRYPQCKAPQAMHGGIQRIEPHGSADRGQTVIGVLHQHCTVRASMHRAANDGKYRGSDLSPPSSAVPGARARARSHQETGRLRYTDITGDRARTPPSAPHEGGATRCAIAPKTT
jgi:hypothetical protein